MQGQVIVSDRRGELPRAVPSLTGIRGVAAVWVVAFHASTILGWSVGAATPLVQRGWSGVDLFFVLSGFILMHAHGADFHVLRGAALWRFAWLRFTRVYPLNFVVLLLIAALLMFDPGLMRILDAGGMGPFNGESFARTALLGFVPGRGDWNQPIWSLSAEVVGYLAFPPIALGLAKVRWAALPLAGCSFAILAALHVATGQVDQNHLSPSSALPRMFCCFFAAAALYQLRTLVAELGIWAGWLAGASVLSLAGCSFSRVGAEAMPALYGVLVFALSYQRGLVARVLSTRVALFFGAISFPLYLVHVVGLFWLRHLIEQGVVSWSRPTIMVWIGLCFGLAMVLHWAVERPVQRFSRRWMRQVPPLPPLCRPN